MQFNQLKNIDTAFKHVRLFSLVLIVACTAISGYSIYSGLQYARQTQDKVYLISDGKAIEAFSANRKDNIAVEARDHIKVFHQLFFTLSPDEMAIDNNLKRALYLADQSAKNQYDNLKEKGYYHQVIGANISQELAMDSIVVQTAHHPYAFTYYGKLRIVRPTVIVTRNLVTAGYLRDLHERTDNNSHGFLIEQWEILQNNDLQTEKR